jgi:SRSO17 transposase
MEDMGMDAQQIRLLEPKLDAFLTQFADCIRRCDTREHLSVYVRGQLSDLPEKSVEPIALNAGVAPRTLQEFLSQHSWDHDTMRDRVQQLVAAKHVGPHRIGIFDETSDPKKGTKTPGVQKQWCGRLGKVENCMVTVHLGFAQGDFHCLLDGELFLPESWAEDRNRCREAGIPDSMIHRPKWEIALDLYDRAARNGVSFEWLTFDEGYGSKPELLRQLSQRRQNFVAEVPKSLTGWLKAPRVVTRPYHRGGRGRPRQAPRLASNSPQAKRVDEWLNDPKIQEQPWQRFRIKDGEKGPIVWECKKVLLTVKDDQGLPGAQWHLLVARHVLNQGELKFFVSNAPEETSAGKLLLVALSRWRVERCFQDQKSEIGLDQYEGRRYIGLKRHLVLSTVSYLFLANVRQEWGEKFGSDCLPTPYCHGSTDPLLVDDRSDGDGSMAGKSGPKDYADPTTNRRSSQEPYQDNHRQTPCGGHIPQPANPMLLELNLAL